MKASTTALRDAILAALRDGGLLTTREVCERVTQGNAHRHYTAVYTNLRALAHKGLIIWRPQDEVSRSALWQVSPAGHVPDDLPPLVTREPDRTDHHHTEERP